MVLQTNCEKLFVDYLVGPLLLVEVGAVAVRDGVRCDLVTVGVEVLHVRVVGPLVGDVERSLQVKTTKLTVQPGNLVTLGWEKLQ